MAKRKKQPKDKRLTQVERGNRALVRWEGTDNNGCAFSLQESSVATEELLWLGPEQMLNQDGQPVRIPQGSMRMHIDREAAGEIGRHLLGFAEEGWAYFDKLRGKGVKV